jgi:hypothetical protein
MLHLLLSLFSMDGHIKNISLFFSPNTHIGAELHIIILMRSREGTRGEQVLERVFILVTYWVMFWVWKPWLNVAK